MWLIYHDHSKTLPAQSLNKGARVCGEQAVAQHRHLTGADAPAGSRTQDQDTDWHNNKVMCHKLTSNQRKYFLLTHVTWFSLSLLTVLINHVLNKTSENGQKLKLPIIILKWLLIICTFKMNILTYN